MLFYRVSFIFKYRGVVIACVFRLKDFLIRGFSFDVFGKLVVDVIVVL